MAPESPRRRRYFALQFLLIGLAGICGALQWLWITNFLRSNEIASRQLGEEIRADMATARPLRESIYQNFVSREDRIGYVVVANFRSGYRYGVINSQGLKQSTAPLEAYLRENGDEATLIRLLGPGQGFAGEYLNVISVAFVPPAAEPDQTPIGVLKVAYIVPGFPYGRGFLHIWWALGGAILVVLIIWNVLPGPRHKKDSPVMVAPVSTSVAEAPKADLEWLEGEPTERRIVAVDEKGESWRILFDGENVEGWVGKGKWYVMEGELVLEPWASSFISEAVAPVSTYQLQLEGKKVAGKDGFIILFPCDGKQLAWVLGGWGNRYSEVGGYGATRSECELDRGAWVRIEIDVGENSLEGRANGKQIWALKRTEVRESSPDVGFQIGMGVAVWSTMAKFRDIRYREK